METLTFDEAVDQAFADLRGASFDELLDLFLATADLDDEVAKKIGRDAIRARLDFMSMMGKLTAEQEAWTRRFLRKGGKRKVVA